MSQPIAASVEVRRRSPVWFWVNTALAIMILIPACVGFAWKFRELVLLYESHLASSKQARLAPEPAPPTAVPEKLERRHISTTEAEDGGFAVAPILNYLLVSLGFLLLFLAAIAHGMFRDIEQPKRDMLAHEQFLDQLEAEHGAPTVGDVASVG
jgi:hypothetical protein